MTAVQNVLVFPNRPGPKTLDLVTASQLPMLQGSLNGVRPARAAGVGVAARGDG